MIGSYELLMMIIRGVQQSDAPDNHREQTSNRGGPATGRVAEEFAEHIAARTVPPIRAIRGQAPCGQAHAQQVGAPPEQQLGCRQPGQGRHLTLVIALPNNQVLICWMQATRAQRGQSSPIADDLCRRAAHASDWASSRP